MALLTMAVWDTEENKKTWMTAVTLESLCRTVDWSKHRLKITDNGSCDQTAKLYDHWQKRIGDMAVFYAGENIGQARALNRAWSWRKGNEHVVRLDNDIFIEQSGWVDRLTDCVERDPAIGIIGLKRKDLVDHPLSENDGWPRTSLKALRYKKDGDTLVVELKSHILGTCQLLNSALLDKVGYLYQFGLKFGHEDVLMGVRSELAGFYNCYLVGAQVEHLDKSEKTTYQLWKDKQAGDNMDRMNQIKEEYMTGKLSIYHGPVDE